jgi:hypothetical protein
MRLLAKIIGITMVAIPALLLIFLIGIAFISLVTDPHFWGAMLVVGIIMAFMGGYWWVARKLIDWSSK